MAIQGKTNTAKAPIYLRFKPNKDGSKSIYIDTIRERKHHYSSLGLRLVPENTVKDRRENARVMREAQKILKEETLSFFNAPVVEANKPLLLSDWITTVCDAKAEKGVGNIRNFRAVARIVRMLFPSVLLKEVDKDFCRDFVGRLTSNYTTHKGKKLAPLTVKTYCIVLCTCLSEGVRAEKIADNPWLKLETADKVRTDPGMREFLTVGELQTMIDTPCEDGIVKKAFIFSCFSGLRRSDVSRLRWADVKDVNNRKYVRIVMKKTKREIDIPLSARALSWLPERGEADEYVFTGFTKGYLSMKLWNWAEAAGIRKKVTFHVARHTFATLLITSGTDIYTVSKLLGHSSVKQTQIYARMVDSVKDAAADAIDNIQWK